MEYNNTPPPMASPPANGYHAQPPHYAEHNQVMPAPAAAYNTTSYSTEKPAWNPAAQAPPAPTGQPQNLVVQRAVELNQLHEEPRLVNCPFCYRETMTMVEQESTSSTTMASIGCCIVGGIICAFLPFYMKMCHDTHHFCSNCGQKIAIRPHEGEVQVFSPQAPADMPPRPVQAPQAVAMPNGHQ